MFRTQGFYSDAKGSSKEKEQVFFLLRGRREICCMPRVKYGGLSSGRGKI